MSDSEEWTTEEQSVRLALEQIELGCRELDLAFMNLHSECLEEILTGAANSQRLVKLNLSMNPLGQEGFLVVADYFKKSNVLAALDLYQCAADEVGAQALCQALLENTSLTSLSLAVNTIGLSGGKEIAKVIKSHPSLASLDLRKTGLGSSVVDIAGALPGSSLRLLNLGENDIEEESGVALFNSLADSNVSLRGIILSGNDLAFPCKSELVHALRSNKSLERVRCTRFDLSLSVMAVLVLDELRVGNLRIAKQISYKDYLKCLQAEQLNSEHSPFQRTIFKRVLTDLQQRYFATHRCFQDWARCYSSGQAISLPPHGVDDPNLKDVYDSVTSFYEAIQSDDDLFLKSSWPELE